MLERDDSPNGAAVGARSAPGRIVAAAARCVAAVGAAGVSLNDVAREAGVSKALILYHFAGKDALFARVIEELAADVVAREQRVLAGEESPLALDALWAWLHGELERGDLCTLLELSRSTADGVLEAARAAAAARRSAAASTIETLFRILQLAPRVPVTLLAEVGVAFVDGLALDAGLTDRRDPREAFDVFWLAMLNLAE